MCERPFLPQITLITQRNAASCIITQIKDSCHTVETMLFMFIQQRCEGTCLLIPCSFLVHSLFIPCSILVHSSLFPCSFLTCEQPILSQITQIIADERQLPHSGDIQFMLFAVSLRYNAACCIPLRDLRNLRENIHARVLNLYCSNETPMSPADLADLRRQNPKQQNSLNFTKLSFSAK